MVDKKAFREEDNCYKDFTGQDDQKYQGRRAGSPP